MLHGRAGRRQAVDAAGLPGTSLAAHTIEKLEGRCETSLTAPRSWTQVDYRWCHPTANRMRFARRRSKSRQLPAQIQGRSGAQPRAASTWTILRNRQDPMLRNGITCKPTAVARCSANSGVLASCSLPLHLVYHHCSPDQRKRCLRSGLYSCGDCSWHGCATSRHGAAPSPLR